MPRLMYDSTNGYDIPTSAAIVAGYIDGAYAWSQGEWDYHSGAVHFRICAVTVDPSAHCADIEAGALSPGDGAAFVYLKRQRGEEAYLYFSESRLGEIQAALSTAGLDPYSSYHAWVALWDGVNVQWDGAPMKQFANPALSGGHYDLSWVLDYLPGVDAVPVQPVPGGAAGTVQAWSGLQDVINSSLPGFGHELGVLASGLDGFA